jgi:hypothetical protein
MDVRLLHKRELWNGFIARQLGQYSYQTFEWGEYLNRQGHIIFRLGAFVGEQLTGVMLLALTRVPIPAPFSLLSLKWMYCYQGPCIAEQHPKALGALLAEAHAIAKREQAIMMRIEAPCDVRESDAYRWHCTLQRLRSGLNSYASDWAKAQGILRYEMYAVLSDQRIYDFVYRPFFYQLWTFISHGHLPNSAQAFQQMQQQVASAATVPLHFS